MRMKRLEFAFLGCLKYRNCVFIMDEEVGKNLIMLCFVYKMNSATFV